MYKIILLRKVLLTYAALVLLILQSYGQDGFWGSAETDIKFNHLQTEQGLSSNVTSCILQDKDGFMWIGTDAGLNRFDGYRVRNFNYSPNTANGLSNGVIKCIFQSTDGFIWIGTDWGLNRFDPVTEEIKYYLSSARDQKSLSNNTISTITEDHEGNLWVGTFLGINKLVGWDESTPIFEHYVHIGIDSTSLSNNRVYSIFCDSKNSIWAGTEGGGVNLLTAKNRASNATKFIHFQHLPNDPTSISANIIYTIMEAKNGVIYIGTNLGFNKLTPFEDSYKIKSYKTDPKNRYSLSENRVYSINDRTDGKIWIGTFGGGLNLFDPQSETFTAYKKNYYDPQSLSRDFIHSSYSKEGILWLVTRETGIDWINPDNQRFIHLKHIPTNPNSLSNIVVKAIEEDKNGKFWFGTFGGGLNSYNPNSKTFTAYKHDPSNSTSISSNIVESLCFDHKGRLWLGTSNGLCLFDESKSQFTRYDHNRNYRNNSQNEYIWYLFPCRDNSGLWIATYDGLIKFDWNSNKFHQFKNDPLNSESLSFNFLRHVYEDKNGYVWIGSWGGGLNQIDLNSTAGLDQAAFIQYKHDPNNKQSISNDLVNIFFEDSKGNFWVGTQGGLNKFSAKTGSFECFTEDDGLVDNVVKGILEDEFGNLWISSQKGLSKFDPTKLSFQNYYKKDGLQADIFNLSSVLLNSRGEMMFGGNNGVSIFKPGEIEEDIINPTVLIDRIRINNVEIKAGNELNGRILIDKAISQMDEIKLNYNQNVISMEFAAIEYSFPDMLEFSYQLEGVDKQWNTVSYTERQVTYSGLDAGKYLFRLRANNRNKTWIQQEKQLGIIVYPAFWATKLAYLIYLSIFFGVAYIIYFNVRNRIQIKRELAVEKEVHRRKMEIEEFKLRFFTNISHDIKTPLTLISVPLQRLMKEYGRISDTQRQRYFSTMDKSVQMLIKLVNQLLFFRKIENKKLLLEVSELDLAAYLQDHANAFIDFAEEKNIQFKIDIPADKRNLFFDPKIIEKVFFNLLSNAFKFTPVGGTVSVKLLENRIGSDIDDTIELSDHEYCGFTVKDTGVGIPEEKINAIFKRFEQLKAEKEMGMGTGIGLAIVKRLVDIHRGHIEVKSTPGSGSSFTIWFPASKDAYDASEIIDIPAGIIAADNNTNVAESESVLVPDPFVEPDQYDKSESSNALKVLIVEDYQEMRTFIKDILKVKYQVTEAENGKKGYEKALLEGPDLIITDVMMPEMNGLEMCKKIKKNVNISHIPVIMLTARNTVENEIEGLETGVNYFIKKPFNIDQLLLVVKNILNYRRDLQLKFSGIKIPEPKEVNVTSVDEILLNKVVEILEENISNSDFSVEDLARQTGLSPVHLYRKFKFLTGMSSSDFIKTFRMKRAVQLLQQNKLRISEVAYAVGFNDPRYFRKCFKSEFGKSPTDYANDLKSESE